MTEYSSGDPHRTLELLWGDRARPSRGPRPALTLNQIARAAIEIADADGLAALSMRAVAERLGFTTMSIYRYVPGKAELLDVMVDTVNAESPMLEQVEGGWRAKMEVCAREEWELFHRHPWVLHLAWHRPALGPNGTTAYESALTALSGIGLSDKEIVAVFNTLYGYVRGVARASVDARLAERRTGQSEDEWWSSRERFWRELADPQRFPTLNRIRNSGAFDVVEMDFEFGLERVLDGLEALVAGRSHGGTAEGGAI
ncbi:TetR/AcrR family transcriptional regulator [Allokutzneria albata]|uniref:Regulatory protein, tetR family n=1 Tax=Allokutzneria albata TaxID=211114 RepID=A0A1H0C2J7_ALLAB|nr:TetR/AcrR family transcriptional regulator [Allokutzneria albata]SDN52079.1 regulatory protein, tetR family [Allokutzneria albata]